MEHRLTAILAADVAGYSRLTEQDEEASTATLRAYRVVVDESIAAHNGHIFTSAGDGVVAEFPSVVEAIRCAVEIQSEIAVRNESVPEDEAMQFRIGVNLGDVISEDNNLYGTGVNVAARLQELAEPGGICISQTVYDQVRKIVEIPFEDIGEHRLKNIAGPVHLYRILPQPLPWVKSLWSNSKARLRRPEFAALILLLIFPVVVGASYYLRQPAALWNALLTGASKGAAIAVLPFVNKGNSPTLTSFSSGLTDDIVTELSRKRDLSVLEYQGKSVNVHDIGRELDVRYVLQGTIAPSGGDLFYIRSKLKDAQTGRTIWSKRFDRNMAKRSLVDDEIACQIVAKIAGGYGVIESTEAKSAKQKSPEELWADDLVVKAREMMQWEWTQENFAEARKLLGQALDLNPDSGPARRELAWYDLMGAVFGVDAQPVSLQKIPANALEAVQLDPEDGRARMVAAAAYFFTKRLNLFEEEAAQAIKDAPCDPEVLAVLGGLLGNIGQWSRGVWLVQRANTLNSAAAQGWYQSTMYLNYYLHGDYERALVMIRQSPDFQQAVTYAYFDYLAICGHIKCTDPTPEEAWRKILEQDPGATAKTFIDWYRLWNFRDKDIDNLTDGAEKTGVFGPEARLKPVAQDHLTEPGVQQ